MIEIRPGDYFCVRTKSPISMPIIIMEKRFSIDKQAEYNHAGIIVKSDGTTYESLKRIAHYDINFYRGCKILIARHRFMTEEAFEKGYKEVLRWNRKAYPWWRLLLFPVGMARCFHPLGIPVCSELSREHQVHSGVVDAELIAMHLEAAGVKQDGYGWTPDQLADEMRKSKFYDVIFEGVL